MNMQTLSILSISNIIPCLELSKAYNTKNVETTSSNFLCHRKTFFNQTGMESSLTLLEMTTSTEHEPDKKFAWLIYTAEPAKHLAHSWLQSARQDAGQNDTLLKRINLKLTTFNVLHAESSENVLIANETSTGLSLNLRTGFYNIQ